MELVGIEENKNNVVVKSGELVRNARYRLSELGIKVVAVLISMIKVSDEDFKEYLIRLDDFKELVGSTSKDSYAYVDVMTEELMKKPFKIGDEKFNWVYYAKHTEGDGFVVLKIAPELKPYLLDLKNNFLQYNIKNILALKSPYVIRLYELCKDHFEEARRYKKSIKSVTFDIKISKIRELFEVPDSYQYSSHIKQRILDKAVEQFKEKTDIEISYKQVKLGRKVDTVHITVKENDRGSSHFVKDINAFKKYVRSNLVNVNLHRLDFRGRVVDISVSPKGKLYLKQDVTDLSKADADQFWKILFNRAVRGYLPSLGQGSLFDNQVERVKQNHIETLGDKKGKRSADRIEEQNERTRTLHK